MPVFGLNNGITPIIAYNYGARHRKRMLLTVKISMLIAFCFTFIGFHYLIVSVIFLIVINRTIIQKIPEE